MVHGVELVLAAAETVTLVFGGVLTYLAYRAFRRTGSGPLRALAAGIGLLTVGVFLGTLLHQIGRLPLEYSLMVQSVFMAAGFATMTYSLFTPPAGGITSDIDSSE